MNVHLSDNALGLGDPPLFAALDLVPSLEVSGDDLEAQNVLGFRNADGRARPFKLLRSQLLRRCHEDNLKLIGITGASPGVGKSFVAANLAAALSRIGDLDVFLIDLDLHRPALAQRFGIEDGLGIHDFLSGEVEDLASVARRINQERLIVVPGFKRPVATGELLTNANGDRLFAGLRALPPSAIVLVDMPPIFADDDAVIIGQRIDAYVQVLEDGRTTRKQAEETVRILQPTPMIGSVLNRYRNQLFSDDYGYGISYGYGGYY